jgi:hypothetical protein
MKKLALILALLLAIGGFAIAEMEPTITGDASITFGYNLDEGSWGFANSNDSSLTLTLVSGSAEKMGEGAWYGVIELADFSIDFDDAGTHYDVEAEDGDDDALTITWGTLITADTPDEVFVNVPVSVTVPDITAKITDGNLYFQFESAPDFAANYVAEIEDDDATEYELGDDVAGGFVFGGTFAPVTFALSLGTEENYETAEADFVVAFPVELVIGLDVSPIMIDLAVAMGLGYDPALDMGVAVQVKADIAPLSIVAAFDLVNGTDLAWELSAGISADIAPLAIGIDVFYADDLDLAVGIDADLAPLTIGVDVELLNVIDALAWTVDGTVDFAASEDITVSAGAGYGSDEVLDANLSVEMTGIIDPMTFTLAWSDGDDLTNDVLGKITFAAEIAY